MRYLYIIILCICIVLLPACSIKNLNKSLRHYFRKYTGKYPQRAPEVTIWIHGTKQFFSKFVAEEFFYNIEGLHPIQSYEERYHARKIMQWLHDGNNETYPLNGMYIFGWSGDLNFDARLEAAQNLYSSIASLRESYLETYGVYPYIRVISHSHGGNVALHMAEVQDQDCDFAIDELILLACPVQERTAPNMKNPLFARVYSIFSSMDSIQIIDPQGFHYWRNHRNGSLKERIKSSFFSERCFKEDEKLLQIKVKFHKEGVLRVRRGLMHVEFIMEPFVRYLSKLINEAEEHYCKTGQPNMMIQIKK